MVVVLVFVGEMSQPNLGQQITWPKNVWPKKSLAQKLSPLLFRFVFHSLVLLPLYILQRSLSPIFRDLLYKAVVEKWELCCDKKYGDIRRFLLD